MKTAIIVHGMPSKAEYERTGRKMANKHWEPWLSGELTKEGIKVYTPEMPEPYAPDYKKWSSVFEQLPIDENTALVGHSCGGGFLVRWLSENKIKVGKVVLVAPWLDPDREHTGNFFDFKIDQNLASRTQGLTLMYSTDDVGDILVSVEKLKNELKGLEIVEFSDKGHFTLFDLKTEKLPELKEILLK